MKFCASTVLLLLIGPSFNAAVSGLAMARKAFLCLFSTPNQLPVCKRAIDNMNARIRKFDTLEPIAGVLRVPFFDQKSCPVNFNFNVNLTLEPTVSPVRSSGCREAKTIMYHHWARCRGMLRLRGTINKNRCQREMVHGVS